MLSIKFEKIVVIFTTLFSYESPTTTVKKFANAHAST